MTDAAVNPLKAGLEDVVVSPSEICFIDGHKGRLIYRGYDVDDLVAHSTFEEVTFLLWQGRLPSRKELDAHLKALASTANRKLPPKLIAMLKPLPKKTTPMEVIRTGVSALSAFDPDAADNSREATLRKSLRLTAQLPTLVAAWERIRRGKAADGPEPAAQPGGQLPVHDERQEADAAGHQDLRHRPDPPRRPRVQRLHLRGPRDRGDPVRPALGRRWPASARSRARCTAGPTSRSC